MRARWIWLWCALLSVLLSSADLRAEYKTIKKGIAFKKISSSTQKIHVLRVHLRSKHVGFRVNRESHRGLTTPQFAKKYGAVAAINGDLFSLSSLQPFGHGGLEWQRLATGQ
ncbi:MAG: hypothetical protein EHM50_11720 [Lysobacterales bacterium]|nr:MAG: hypothetical protein EHM50_11720 [Xanthomonadales bacterium]